MNFISSFSKRKLKSFETELPAPWIEGEDRDWAFQSRMLLSMIIQHFEEAVIAFSLFEPLNIEKMILRGADGEITVLSNKWEDALRSASVKMFISALDGIGKIIGVLRRDERSLPKTVDACKGMEAQFAIVKQIRDSQQHLEDRCRGLGKGRKGKPEEIQSGILLLGTWKDGNQYHFTGSDGKQYGIEISEAVLRIVQANIEKLIWSFDWIGPGNILVRRA